MDLVNRINIVLVLLVIKEIFGYDDAQDLSDTLIHDLYQKYKEAINRDGDLIILRRQFDQKKLFEIHVKKLKEVNGYKLHNLMIKGNVRTGSPIIYINNPVESKMPNAYLTLEEFKEALTKRVQKRKQTTLSLIDVFFTTKKRIHKNTIVKNSTIVLKDTTTKPSFTNVTPQKERTGLRTIKSTRDMKFGASTSISSIATIEPPENRSSTDEKTSPQTTEITAVQIEDLLFIRASPMTYNTGTEDYSNMSVGTDKYDNTTKETSSKIRTVINDREAANTSHIQNKNGLTLVSSLPYNTTKIKETTMTVLSLNKTNDSEIGISDNMVTDYDSRFERKDDSLEKPPPNKFTIEGSNDIINKPIYDNTYISTTTVEVLSTNYTQLSKIKSEGLVNNTDASTTEPDNIMTKQYVQQISNKTYTEKTKLEANITIIHNEYFVTNATELDVSKSGYILSTTNSSTFSESTKRIPKRKATTETSVKTPWRRRTRERSTTKSGTKAKRSTLGRPLVFMGGP